VLALGLAVLALLDTGALLLSSVSQVRNLLVARDVVLRALVHAPPIERFQQEVCLLDRVKGEFSTLF